MQIFGIPLALLMALILPPLFYKYGIPLLEKIYKWILIISGMIFFYVGYFVIFQYSGSILLASLVGLGLCSSPFILANIYTRLDKLELKEQLRE